MLFLMTVPYCLARLLNQRSPQKYDLQNAGALGIGILFVFTGIGHFIQTEDMAQMLPNWICGRTQIVYLTGILEFVIAIGFFVPTFRRIAGWAAAIVLVLFFPANIYAAINNIPMGGHVWGPAYLLVRTPLQIGILLWVYGFTIKRESRQLQRATDRDAEI